MVVTTFSPLFITTQPREMMASQNQNIKQARTLQLTKAYKNQTVDEERL